MKESLLKIMRSTGAFAALRMRNRNRALILTYHRFDRNESTIATSTAAFEEQLAYLASNYSVVPLSEMAQRLSGKGAVPARMAAITIDDGYRDAYRLAYPLLRKYNLPATLYVVTEFASGRGWIWTDKMRYIMDRVRTGEIIATINGQRILLRLTDEAARWRASEELNAILKKLEDVAKEEAIRLIAESLQIAVPDNPPDEFASIDWDQAREMDRNGVEIGSHTMTHPILTKIPMSRLKVEMEHSRLKLEEELNRRVVHFCYPNGDNDERVRDEVKIAGYQSAVTCNSGLDPWGIDMHSLRRIHTEDTLIRFIHTTSGFEGVKNRLQSHFKASAGVI